MIKINFKALLIFLSFSISLAPTGAQAKEAWFAYVAPGEGQGLFGHGFIVFTEANQDPLLGTAYSYGFQFTKSSASISKGLDFALALSGIKAEGTGVLEKAPFFSAYRYYALQSQRSILLQRLNLSAQEQETAIRLFEEEIVTQKDTKYSLLNNNCVSYLLRTLSKAVSPDKRIHQQQMEWLLPTLNSIKKPSEEFLSRFPVIAPYALKNHPLFSADYKLLRPFSEQQQELFENTVLKEAKTLAQCLGFGSSTQEILELNIALAILTEKPEYLNPISAIVVHHPGCLSSTIQLFGDIFNCINPFQSKIRAKIYAQKEYLKSRIGK